MIFFGKMCFCCFTYNENCRFSSEKTVRPQNGLLIFLGKETHSETKSWKIVEDFDEKSYNNNGKPWKSSRILRAKAKLLHFSFFFHHFSPFFRFFPFFHFFLFHVFLFSLFFSQFFIFHFFKKSFFLFSFSFHFLSFSVKGKELTGY